MQRSLLVHLSLNAITSRSRIMIVIEKVKLTAVSSFNECVTTSESIPRLKLTYG